MKRVWLLAAALGLLTVACSSSEPIETIPPEPGIVLETAATAMGAVDSVRFRIERGGAPVYIDPLDTLNFSVAGRRKLALSH